MQKIEEVYLFYIDKFKPLYAELVALNNKIPAELLFEIHAAFDHISRYYQLCNEGGEADEAEFSKRAYSHLKRGLLDAFKLRLKYYHNEYEQLISMPGLDIIDNGQFAADLRENRHKITKAASKARLDEGNKDIDIALENWYIAYEGIEEFYEKFFTNKKLLWAKQVAKRYGFKTLIISIAISFLAGLAANNINYVWDFILCFIK